MGRNKGISLIVLVITIIVMIILAGAIIITLSNSGIITKANEAVDLTNSKQLKEYVTSELILNGWYSGKTINKAEHLEGIEDVTITDLIEGDTWVLSKDAAKVTVYSTGDVVEGEMKLWTGESSAPEIKEGNWYIYTPEQLKFLADVVNGGNVTEGYKIEETTTVYLMNDLDLGARQENGTKTIGTAWVPIGPTDALKFKGTFEGNNHIIRGVYVSIDGNFAGIFGNSNTIKNLIVKDSYIKTAAAAAGGLVAALRTGELTNCHNVNTQVVGGTYAIGGVIGQFTGTKLSNCSNSGYVLATGTYDGGDNQIGGIVGRYTGETIEGCTNSGKVEAEGNWVGGIVGIVTDGRNKKVNITNCVNSGEITSKTSQTGGLIGIIFQTADINNCTNNGKVFGEYQIGGIVGTTQKTINIDNCINNGNISGQDARVGGIVGETYNVSNAPATTIKNCGNTGIIYGYMSGGIVGALNGSVENCYNTGNIKGNKSGLVGGIVGISVIDAAVTIKNTYNIGVISAQGIDVSYVGGIIGRIFATDNPTLTNNYNIGKIEAKGENVGLVGGILGFANTSTINENYNYYIEGTLKTEENAYGEAKTSAEMKTDAFVTLLNTGLAEAAWEIRAGENDGYPVIKGLK